jgi:amino acid transporter
MALETTSPAPSPSTQLGLWDAVSIIVGIVIGTAIFRSPTTIFQNVPGAATALALWVAGGVVSWCGAVCYAELATTYPRDGGDYEYLSRAFGRWCGFLFAWAQLTVIISGNIAVMAYAFVDYGSAIWLHWREHAVWYAIAPIIALTAVNLAGVVAGKLMQNLLSILKVAGLAAIVAAGLLAGAKPRLELAADGIATPVETGNIGLALVFVLYAYGGWIHAGYVAAEVRDQRRNMPRALILGIAAITLIYFAVNAAYLVVLGFEGARETATPAADVMQQAVGRWGSAAVSILVMLSALAAINGMILTGARVYAVWGEDFPQLRWLSTWGRRGAPIAAILVQSSVALALILLVGTSTGRAGFDAALAAAGIAGLPWEKYFGGFETLVAGTAPVYWGFCFLTGVAIFVLRFVDRGAERPYSTPFFPLPPIVLCASCAYVFYASLVYARWLALIGFLPMAAGGVIWYAVRGKSGPN